MKDGEAARVPAEEDGASRKKPKLDDEQERALIPSNGAFELYRNHLDTLEHEEEDNLSSNLQELVQLFESSAIRPFHGPLSSISSVDDMLGILASVVYFQMASTAIERYLNGDTSHQPQDYIDKSLMFYPENAACWSMGANFGRITGTLPRETVTQWYQRAAQHAQQVRQETLKLLESDNVDDSVKEWMELLLLQQVVDVEYIMEDDDDSDDGHFSASSVEGTSRFMAAMLLSRDGYHNVALNHLKYFPLTHRLHPNVWTGQGSRQSNTAVTTKAPAAFRGVLPPNLYQRMCKVFGPDANFWRESDYANQGYYSFLAKMDGKIKNLIDDIVVNHLLPLAKQFLGKEHADTICAYEWWAHSRQASLGHTLHFDTDEASLAPDQTVHHPLLSSVLHLTGDERSGATILLDQTPDSDSARVCWRSVPHPNTFMAFPGNLLHGVLPCPGDKATSNTNAAASTNTGDSPTEGQWIKASSSPSSRRLTFMVGFKTRHVPDQRRGQTLYGPCAPLPSDEEAEWVKDIQLGYGEQDSTREARVADIIMKELPCVFPAWERIPRDDNRIRNEQPLELPEGIDHRFFVNGEPAEYFRRSLYEHDDVP